MPLRPVDFSFIESYGWGVMDGWMAGWQNLASLSLGAKMAMQIFVKRVFTIFATNAPFLRVIANLQI